MNIIEITKKCSPEQGGNNHGEACTKTTNKNYRIVDYDKNVYRVKKKLGPFYFYIRTNNFKPLEFYNFGDVVRYVIKRRRSDGV